MHNYKYLLNQAKGKYIAILESDDIWLDPFKLHKQVEIIEKLPIAVWSFLIGSL